MTVKINLSRAASRSDIGDTLQITFGQPDIGEALAASAVATTSTIAATSTAQIWEIAPDVDVWVAFGAAPDPAVVGARRFLVAGVARNFGVRAVGEKIAILAA